ncbi:MAG: metallopeptidase TldD-related protein [Jatrophihabitans sp.]
MSAPHQTTAAPQDVVEHALRTSSADGCVVIVVERRESNLRWAANSLTTNGQMASRAVTVISVRSGADGTRAGVVTRSAATLDDVTALVRDSEKAADQSDPADDATDLVEPYPHTDDWGAAAADSTVEVFSRFAPDLGSAFQRVAARDELLYGFAEHIVETSFLGTSTGLRRRWVQPTGRLEVNAKSADLSRSAWHGVPTRDFTDVDVLAVADILSQRLDWARNRIELPAGRYETLLPPSAVADLMLDLYLRSTAREAEEGRSVWSDAQADGGTRIGQKLSPLPVRLWSDPAADGVRCAPFSVVETSFMGLMSIFDNGAPCEATDWIADGALHDLLRNRAWARKTDQPPCQLIDNLLLDAGGTKTLDEMIAGTERGLLLTCLWYIREVDPQTALLTGLTRDGVYLIENGAVQGAVTNFRFNESPVGMLARILEAGRSDRTLPREWNDYFTRAVMPPLRIRDFNMSTVSDAS